MDINVEDAKKYKKASDELILTLKEKLPTGYFEYDPLEEFAFEFNGEKIALMGIGSDNWDDEGKYQYNTEYYQLVSYNPKKASYPCNQSIIDKYDIIISIGIQRSGSYFSEYYYTYEGIVVERVAIERIPPQVIPAHDEVKFVEL